MTGPNLTQVNAGIDALSDFLQRRLQSYMEPASSGTPLASAAPVVTDTMTYSGVGIPLVCAQKVGGTAEWQAGAEVTDSEGVAYLPLKIKGDVADWRFCHYTNKDWADVNESTYGPESYGGYKRYGVDAEILFKDTVTGDWLTKWSVNQEVRWDGSYGNDVATATGVAAVDRAGR